MRREPALREPRAETRERAAMGPATAAGGVRTGQAQHARGMAQLQQGQLDEAEASFREALGLEPKLAAAWNGLARIHAERGDLDQSCQACRNAIALDARQAEAYWRLATNLKGQVSDDELQAMEDLISLASLSNEDRALLCFALAAVMERRGRFDLAAARLAQAHAYHSAAKAARSLAYDPDVYTRLIDQIMRSVHGRLRRAAARLGNCRSAAGLHRRSAAIGHHAHRADHCLAPESPRRR